MARETQDRAALNDVEEPSDRYLHRPLARPLVRLLLPTAVTPNQVTMMSGVAGVAAGVSLALGVERPLFRLMSAALLFSATVLDCIDGQLARARHVMSSGGMALDTAADVVVGIAMVIGATYFSTRMDQSPILWRLMPIVLASYGLHCLLFDIVKERYLADHRIAYASSKATAASRPPARAGAMHWIFDAYWRFAGPIIQRSRSRRIGRREVRAWTLLGPGTHMTCLYVAAAVAVAWPPAVYACLLVFGAGMNVWMLGLVAASAAPVRG